MTDVTWERFHQALTDPTLRPAIGLVISDADAQQLRNNDDWAKEYYRSWSQMAVVDEPDVDPLFDEQKKPRLPFSRRTKVLAAVVAAVLLGAAASVVIGSNGGPDMSRPADVSLSHLSPGEQAFVDDARKIGGLQSTAASETAGEKSQVTDKLNAQLTAHANAGCTLDLTDPAVRATLTSVLVTENVFTEKTAPAFIDRIGAYCYGA